MSESQNESDDKNLWHDVQVPGLTLFYPCVTFNLCATWLVYVRHDSYMCDKSLLSMEHDLFMCMEKHLWRGVQVPGLPIVFSLCDILFMCHMTCLCATWLINVQHEFLMDGTWLIHVHGKILAKGASTRPAHCFIHVRHFVCVQQGLFMCDTIHMCATRVFYVCNMTPVATNWSELSRGPTKVCWQVQAPCSYARTATFPALPSESTGRRLHRLSSLPSPDFTGPFFTTANLLCRSFFTVAHLPNWYCTVPGWPRKLQRDNHITYPPYPVRHFKVSFSYTMLSQ